MSGFGVELVAVQWTGHSARPGRKLGGLFLFRCWLPVERRKTAPRVADVVLEDKTVAFEGIPSLMDLTFRSTASQHLITLITDAMPWTRPRT